MACAPGYPGSTVEAQPDPRRLCGRRGQRLGPRTQASSRPSYYESEAPGLERLARPDAAFALVPLPFFLKHEKALKLVAQAQASPQGGEATETWSLVAGKGRLAASRGLDGWEIVSLAAYAPAFIRGCGPRSMGQGARHHTSRASGAVISALERAATGEKVAVLLDRAQAAALDSLPFYAGSRGRHPFGPHARGACSARLARRAGEASGARRRQGPARARGSTGGSGRALGPAAPAFEPVDEAGLARARQGYAAALAP